MHHPTDRITHTTAFVPPVVEHWLERETAQWDIVSKPCIYFMMGQSTISRPTCVKKSVTTGFCGAVINPSGTRLVGNGFAAHPERVFNNSLGKCNTTTPSSLSLNWQRCYDPRKRVQLITGRKEGNVLFNDALNTFYSRLYGVGHMVKDHSDSERGNPLPPRNGLFFPNSSKVSFIYTIPQTG